VLERSTTVPIGICVPVSFVDRVLPTQGRLRRCPGSWARRRSVGGSRPSSSSSSNSSPRSRPGPLARRRHPAPLLPMAAGTVAVAPSRAEAEARGGRGAPRALAGPAQWSRVSCP
jgi:hypothetical protein